MFHALDVIIDQRVKLRESEHYVLKNDMLDTLMDISKEDSQQMDVNQIKHLLLVRIFLSLYHQSLFFYFTKIIISKDIYHV